MSKKVYRDKGETVNKFYAIFAFISLFFIFFFIGTIQKVFDKDNSAYLYTKIEEPSFRGSIKSKDGVILAHSISTWYLALNGKHFQEDKLDLVARLISIYTGKDENLILKELKKRKRVVLEPSLTVQEAKRLKKLSNSLNSLGALKTFIKNGIPTKFAFEIAINDIQKREYLYSDLLTPILGFVRKADGEAVTGLEKFHTESLQGGEKSRLSAQKDIGGNPIWNNSMEFIPSVDGSLITLNIDSKLQKRIEEILSAKKREFEAEEVIAAIMESDTGRVVAIASSNRYNPKHIIDVGNTRMSHTQYFYEPGSVIKPIFLAKAMELGLVKRFDIFNGHNGRWKLERKTIVDDVKKLDWISAENILVYSSNIGISQVALKLKGYEMKETFDDFGISRLSDIDLPYEREGIFPTADMYDNSDIYKATSSYGYGFQTNFIRIVKAYSVFNNNGKISIPRIAYSIVNDPSEKPIISPVHQEQVLSSATANTILSILRKTATKGTAAKANVEGVFVAGKTGTAHIAEGGKYVNRYNSSFFGFANDEKRKYTLGVTFIEPTTQYFSSQTAAPTAKMIIESMVEMGHLTKTVKENRGL